MLGIKKQSRVQYDTSLHAFMSASVRLVLQKLWIELSTRGTIKVVRESSLPELSEQRLAGYLRSSPALFLKTCDLETQLSNQANEIKAPITPRYPPTPHNHHRLCLEMAPGAVDLNAIHHCQSRSIIKSMV